VNLTIQLEALLPREVSSPYRQPLIKFLSCYPAEAVDYFVSDRLTNPLYNKLWGFVLNHPLADELRNELAKTPTKLINATFNYNQGRPPMELQFQGILMTRTLVKFLPDWLAHNRPVLDCLLAIWKSPSVYLQQASSPFLRQLASSRGYMVGS
jgi:transformation/transcription domain-associated protein